MLRYVCGRRVYNVWCWTSKMLSTSRAPSVARSSVARAALWTPAIRAERPLITSNLRQLDHLCAAHTGTLLFFQLIFCRGASYLQLQKQRLRTFFAPKQLLQDTLPVVRLGAGDILSGLRRPRTLYNDVVHKTMGELVLADGKPGGCEESRFE